MSYALADFLACVGFDWANVVSKMKITPREIRCIDVAWREVCTVVVSAVHKAVRAA